VSRRWKHGHASALPLQSCDWSRSGLQPVQGAYWQLSLSWGGLRSGWLEPILAQGFLDVLGAGSFDGLVDRECLAQMRAAFTAVAVLEVAVADSFQGASFLEGVPPAQLGVHASQAP
jgi:hypothetical protein